MDKDTLLKKREEIAALKAELDWSKAVRNGGLADKGTRGLFLVQGIEEDRIEFQKRAELCTYAPLTTLIAERIAGAVFKRPPTFDKADALKEFIEEATQNGQDLPELVKAATMEALWGKFAVILVDRPAATGSAPLTQAEAQAKRLDKPYCVVYPSEQVIDYRLNLAGQLEYIKLDGPCYRRPTDGKHVREVREITLAGIVTWRIVDKETVEGGEVAPLAPALVAANQLPVVPVGYDTIDGVLARSPFSGALQAELDALRELSNIIWGLWIAGHPTMLVKIRGDASKVGVGVNRFLLLKPTDTAGAESEEIKFLEAQLPGLKEQVARYEAARHEIQQQAGVRPIATEAPSGASAPAESGVAQAIRVDSEAYVLGNVADMAADVAWEVLKVVALDMGQDPEGITVTYVKDFGLQAGERMMAIAQTLRSMLGGQHPATKEAIRRAVLATLDNLPADLQAEIEEAIDADGAQDPMALRMPNEGGSPFGNSKPKPKNTERAVPAGPGGKPDQGKAKE